MSMQAASLELLEKASLPAPQARAIVQAIDIEITAAQNVLATKQDVHVLELKIESSFKEISRNMYEVARNLYAAIFGGLIGTMGILLGVCYFFVTHVTH
jgi:hypothetical protein